MPPSSPSSSTDNGIVIDIGRAHEVLKSILGPLNYKNLDALPEFAGRNTTTEVLTRHIYDRLAEAAAVGQPGPRRQGAEGRAGHDLRIAMSHGPGTKRLCGSARRLRHTGRARDVDRRLRPTTAASSPSCGQLGWEVGLVGLGDGFPRPSATQREIARRAAAGRIRWPSDRDRRAGLWRAARGRGGGAGQAGGGGAGPSSAGQRDRFVAAGRGTVSRERTGGAGLGQSRHRDQRGDCRPSRRAPRRGRARGIEVVPPGTDRAPFSVGSGGPEVRLLSVGAVGSRKGFDLLVEALAPLADLPWRLTIAGDRTRDPPAVERLDAVIAHHRLEDRIDCLGRRVARTPCRALCERRSVRAGVALRGLRHGLRRGDRARPAGDRHDRRGDPAHGAGFGRPAGSRPATSPS